MELETLKVRLSQVKRPSLKKLIRNTIQQEGGLELI